MSETKFTPGPHRAERISGTSGQYLITDGKKHLALVPSGANAKLYAAAPDMYGALEDILQLASTETTRGELVYIDFTEIRDVLKKARGEV